MDNMPSISNSSPATVRPSIHRPFDVFINHRGMDVKNTLASHIFYALESRGIRVFLDKDRMETGELIPAQIEDAIRNASVHIAIFSKNYAGSPWCLKELCLMMQKPAKILAVFYDVEPCHLRWMDNDGPYANALKTHREKGRYESQTLEEWERALFNAAGRSGCELEKGFNGDEGALVNHIVNNVVKRVKADPLDVAKFPVGLDEVAEDFERTMLLRVDGNEEESVKVVGIVGMGGAGKTTLAKHLFNIKRSSYGRSSFLFDVRSSSLTDLQGKLFRDLTGIDKKIYNPSEGTGVFRNRLSNCQALVILDDIDGVNQLEALLVVKDVLSSGSLILVTSRDKGLLKRSQISFLYDMKKLPERHARELFCWHAFLGPSPTEDEFEILIQRYLVACDGLPLSLKVVGALLYGHNITYWQYKLKGMSLEDDVKERLKISYDALDGVCQQMFLDAACFFIGEEKGQVTRMWDGCGWNGWFGLHTLENKCLIEIDERDRIRMHDQLRDMGRDIADAEPNNPRRLWRPDDVLDFQRRSRTTQVIRGIRIIADASPCWLHDTPRFESLDGWKELLGICAVFFCRPTFETSGLLASEGPLKLLLIEGDILEDNWRSALPAPIWLRWVDCPYRILPLRLHSMEQLRVLELFGGHIQTLWHDSKGIPAQLRELTIKYCPVKFPKSIGQLKLLEKIVWDNDAGRNIKTLPDEFCWLESLKHLELSSFRNLEFLPQNFGDLTNLQHLELSVCPNLQALPDSSIRLKQLRFLRLYRCQKLSFRQVTLRYNLALEHVDFYGCDNLEVLPIQITRQTWLETLKLENTRLKELPNEIGDLKNLKVLELGSLCLSSLPSSIWNLSSLTTLHLWNCTSLKGLPDDPASLKAGYLRGGFEHMRNLEFLNVQNCPLSEVIPFTSVVKMLDKEQTVSNLRGSAGLLPKLKMIRLRGTDISSISITENIYPSLTFLNLDRSIYLVEVGALPEALTGLSLRECGVLKRITGLSNLTKLLWLNITGCRELEELPNLEKLRSLESFYATGCWELEELPDVSRLTSLKRLRVEDCGKLKSIKGLEKLTGLEELNISAENESIWNDIQFVQRLPHCKLSSTCLTARAVPGVERAVETVLGCIASRLSMRHGGDYGTFKAPDINSASALMVCTVFSAAPRESVEITGRQANGNYSIYCSVRGKGKWINMNIFTRDSTMLTCMKNQNADELRVEHLAVGMMRRGERETVETEQGWIVTATDDEEHKKITEMWNKLVCGLHSDCGIS